MSDSDSNSTSNSMSDAEGVQHWRSINSTTTDVFENLLAPYLIPVTPTEDEDEDRCPICRFGWHELDAEAKVVRINNCGHQMHKDCIMTWFVRIGTMNIDNSDCPYCRQDAFDLEELAEAFGSEISERQWHANRLLWFYLLQAMQEAKLGERMDSDSFEGAILEVTKIVTEKWHNDAPWPNPWVDGQIYGPMHLVEGVIAMQVFSHFYTLPRTVRPENFPVPWNMGVLGSLLDYARDVASKTNISHIQYVVEFQKFLLDTRIGVNNEPYSDGLSWSYTEDIQKFFRSENFGFKIDVNGLDGSITLPRYRPVSVVVVEKSEAGDFISSTIECGADPALDKYLGLVARIALMNDEDVPDGQKRMYFLSLVPGFLEIDYIESPSGHVFIEFSEPGGCSARFDFEPMGPDEPQSGPSLSEDLSSLSIAEEG